MTPTKRSDLLPYNGVSLRKFISQDVTIRLTVLLLKMHRTFSQSRWRCNKALSTSINEMLYKSFETWYSMDNRPSLVKIVGCFYVLLLHALSDVHYSHTSHSPILPPRRLNELLSTRCYIRYQGHVQNLCCSWVGRNYLVLTHDDRCKCLC